MSEDKFDGVGPKMSTIGEEAAADVGGDPNGIYLYVEVGDRWISVNLFRDEGDVVRAYEPSPELTDAIWDAWEAENDPKLRWSVMEYEARSGKFDARFKYPEEVDVESFELDRREIALKKRYGDKSVVYPPLSGEAMEYKPD